MKELLQYLELLESNALTSIESLEDHNTVIEQEQAIINIIELIRTFIQTNKD